MPREPADLASQPATSQALCRARSSRAPRITPQPDVEVFLAGGLPQPLDQARRRHPLQARARGPHPRRPAPPTPRPRPPLRLPLRRRRRLGCICHGAADGGRGRQRRRFPRRRDCQHVVANGSGIASAFPGGLGSRRRSTRTARQTRGLARPAAIGL